MDNNPLGSSFRDPSGYVFTNGGVIYRHINPVFIPTYQQFMKSGLYGKLVKQRLLVAHREVKETKTAGITIKPEQIPLISYPYEWCFNELKDAAIATLEIQKLALSYGFTRKDASAFNIQFFSGKPILIDTLSFEPYEEVPWVAYRQFCMHFLAPLLLMSTKHAGLHTLLRSYIDGIPLDLTSALLPKWTWANVAIATHIHFHAMMEKKYADKPPAATGQQLSQGNLTGILASLEDLVRGTSVNHRQKDWETYYETNSYSQKAFKQKRLFVKNALQKIHPKTVLDVGCNTGFFSRLAAAHASVIAVDNDSACIDQLYDDCKKNGDRRILPLVIDITNPTPAAGWASKERQSFLERAHVDTILALALVHHLAIDNNVPLPMIARLFASLAPNLIIEFVPKEDPRVAAMLAHRRDIFMNYSTGDFERAFFAYFTLDEKSALSGSTRILYRMHRKANL